jgi:hypothetical protein
MAENAGAVKFEGQPPFLLPEAKSAQADLFERSAVVTLYSEIEGQGPGLALNHSANVARCCAGLGDSTHARLIGRQGKGP